jgi:hypothetical protein
MMVECNPRGIICSTIHEETALQLFASAVRGFPGTTRRQHRVDYVKVENIKYSPWKLGKVLLISADVIGETKTYKVHVLFENVNFVWKVTPKSAEIISDNGSRHIVEKIDIRKSDIKVRCECMDFQHRFSYQNDRDKALYDNPIPYQRKTNRPSVNPGNVNGACKHLMAFMESLSGTGIMS